MGITRSGNHKRTASGAKKSFFRKKRNFEKGRQPSDTRIGVTKVKNVRVRGGNIKRRALRLDSGVFTWQTEDLSRKLQFIDVVYHPTNNELVRTKTLTKSSVVTVNSTPLREAWEAAHGKSLPDAANEIEPTLFNLMSKGTVYAIIRSRPGQIGAADGYILEEDELKFYLKKLNSKA